MLAVRLSLLLMVCAYLFGCDDAETLLPPTADAGAADLALDLAANLSPDLAATSHPQDLSVSVDAEAPATGSVKVQILAFNDFHGNLQPPTGSSGRLLAQSSDPQVGDGGTVIPDAGLATINAGGAAYLAAHVQKLRAGNPNTVVVSAGDLSGASPLVSSIFHDEPSVLIMNALGLDFNAVGNHEFDHGISELLRLQYGGCHPVDGCTPGLGAFPGASFQYLAANVEVGGGKTVFPRYGIREIDGEKIAFVGMTLEDTPTIVSATAVAGLTFDDEVSTVNALVPSLRALGCGTIVVVVHQGSIPAPNTTYDGCGVMSGAIVDIANGLDPAVDVIVSAHTHQAYACTIKQKLVTSAASFGRLVTSIDLTIDHATHRVVDKVAHQHIVTRDIAPDPAVQALVTQFVTLAAPRANKVVGHLASDLKAAQSPAGESPLGDVIADAMLDGTRAANLGGAVVAFMNPGGIRADIPFAPVSSEQPGEITFGKAFTTQPFANNLFTLTLTGAQLKQVLEQQWNVAYTRILQVSSSFTYSYSASAPIGARVDAASMKINGVVVDPAASYRVTVNNFLATGGDGFTVLNAGTQRLTGALDIDAMVAYLGAHDPISPPVPGRITVVP
jgi:5'-nucleotidase